MKIIYTFLLCILATSLFANERAKILVLERQRYNLMEASDTTELSFLIASSVMYIHSNGMLDTKTSFLNSIATKELVHKKITTSEEVVRLYHKKMAIVTGKSIYDINWRGQDMTLNFFHTNVYYKVRGKWLLINRQTSKIS
jgi:hypothetical protein